jgi:hypothetical protein
MNRKYPEAEYFGVLCGIGLCRRAESNRWPTDYESVALPTELLRHKKNNEDILPFF